MKVEFNIGVLKVINMSGAASLVIGTGKFGKQMSHSKTNNGMGNFYGDEAKIDAKPYKTVVYDADVIDNPQNKGDDTYKVHKVDQEFQMD